MARYTIGGDGNAASETAFVVRPTDSDDGYAPIAVGADVPVTVNFTHSGTVTISAVNLENPDVDLAEASSTSSPASLTVPPTANAIKFHAGAAHAVTIPTGAGQVAYAKNTSALDGKYVIIGAV